MAGILLEETSPLGNIVAVVEDDDRVVYFYLHFPNTAEDDPQRMKVCWVRNRLPAPKKLNQASMERGEPPLMPAAHCVDSGAGKPLDRESLRIVWFEECDAAALLERDEALAIIPSWSGMGDLSGYARDCIGQGPFAWALERDNAMHDRIAASRDFWTLWDDERFWQWWRDERIAALESVLGQHSKYYAIDGDEFPPRAMLRFDLSDRYLLITVGVSLFCQPKVELHFDDPSPYRRIELAAAFDRICPAADLTRLGQYISAQARYPWNHFAPLGHGHTMPCDSTPSLLDPKRFDSVLFSQTLPETPQLNFPDFRGDRTNILWLLPISQRERDLAVKAGTDELERQLAAAGTTVVIRARKELKLPS
ncbi:MAG: suppressor of fused domain protein [Planctomycetaceae bacterium]|nr:suppressor of fused domain protein [Planctomycetaceae bacterium]